MRWRAGPPITLLGLLACTSRADLTSNAPASASAAPRAAIPSAPPSAEPLSLTGPCVTPPTASFVVYAEGTVGTAHPMWTAETHTAKLDVDGLGTPVVLVPSTSAGTPHPSNVRFTMYLMRGSCGVDIGAFQGLNEPSPLDTRSHGLRDLENLWPTGMRGHEGGALAVEILRFDGQRYLPVGPPMPR